MFWWLCLLVPAPLGLAWSFRSGRGGRWGFPLAGGGTLAGVLILAVHGMPPALGPLRLDALSVLFLLPVGVAGTLAAALADLGRRERSLAALLLSCLVLAAASDDLVLLWAALETAALSFALLVDRCRTPASLEAAWKSVLLLGAAGLVSLLSLGFLLAGAGGTSPDWSILSRVPLDSAPAAAAFLLALVGFGAKLGLFPLHPWLPAAYRQAPLSAVLLSAADLDLALYALIRYAWLLRPSLGPLVTHALLLAGLATALAGALFLSGTRDLRGLLAYATMESMGVALAGIGSGTGWGAAGGLLLVLGFALAKPLLFLAADAMSAPDAAPSDPPPGSGRRGALLLLGGGLAVLGFPPFLGFFGDLGVAGGLFRASPTAAGVFLVAWCCLLAAFLRRLTGIFGPASRPGSWGPWRRGEVLAAAAAVALLGVSLHLPLALGLLIRKGAALLALGRG